MRDARLGAGRADKQAEIRYAPISDVREAPGSSGEGIKQRLCFLQPISDALAPASVLADIAADLVGPGVKFQSGKVDYIHI